MTSASPPRMMKNNYRTRIDILANVLHIASEGARKTRLMYDGNLNNSRLQSCLNELLRRDLIQANKGEDGRVLYTTTSKGIEFLTTYKELKQLMF